MHLRANDKRVREARILNDYRCFAVMCVCVRLNAEMLRKGKNAVTGQRSNQLNYVPTCQIKSNSEKPYWARLLEVLQTTHKMASC